MVNEGGIAPACGCGSAPPRYDLRVDDLERSPKGAMRVWLVALSVYLLAVFHRSSMAVAGIEAAHRFGISASALATFTMLQLLVYAGMQVPVGLILDRFGSRRVLLAGLVAMTVGQAIFATTGSYPGAVVARVLVGMGDAMTFICVLRLVTTWFAPRRIPLVTQLTGVIGQIGAIIAAAPMTWALAHLGWSRTYGLAAAAGVVLAVILLFTVHDSPRERSMSGPVMSLTQIRLGLSQAWSHPGTRLGFWTHFSTQFSATTMSLLWGFPFLVLGQGLTHGQASTLLTILVLAVIAAGPVLAAITSRHAWHRSDTVIAVIVAIAGMWTIVLAWPGAAPLPVLVALMIVVGVGGPASLIGFDFGRTSNPPARLGSATGIINQGGFIASLALVIVIGMILDWRTPAGHTYTPAAFTWAMSFQYVIWTLGLVQVWRYRRRARQRVTSGHDPVP